MRFRLWLELSALMLAPTAAIGQDVAMGEVTLDNRSADGADLYIDGSYACSASPHGRCTARVPTGVHVVTIEFADGDHVMGDVFDLAADVPVTVPVVDLMVRS